MAALIEKWHSTAIPRSVYHIVFSCSWLQWKPSTRFWFYIYIYICSSPEHHFASLSETNLWSVLPYNYNYRMLTGHPGYLGSWKPGLFDDWLPCLLPATCWNHCTWSMFLSLYFGLPPRSKDTPERSWSQRPKGCVGFNGEYVEIS